MKHIAASVTVAVPAELCFKAAADSYADPRWQHAYAALRPGRTYSARLGESQRGRRLEYTVGATDAFTGAQLPSFGYRITYTFTPEGEASTRAEVSIEYDTLAAVGAMGTLQGQAENEVLHRLAGLLALETGSRAGAPSGGA
jgi:uncharacterized protein YndB with AHSA1/START domain